MDFADENLAELFEQYKDEVRENIGTLDTELVAIEQDPTNSEVIFAIFRNLHSLKGSSKMFNVDNIGHIAHKLEDLMQIIDKNNSILGQFPSVIDLLFKGNDIFRDVINRLEDDIGYVNLTPKHAQFIEEINTQLDRINRKENTLVEASKALLEELETLLPNLEETDTDNLGRLMTDLSANIKLFSLEGGGEEIRYTYGSADVSESIHGLETGLEKFRAESYTENDVADFFDCANNLLQALFEVAEEDIMEILSELGDGLDLFQEKSLDIDAMVIEFFSLLLQDIKEKLKAEAISTAPIEEPEEVEVQVEAEVKPPKRESMTKTIRVDEKKIDLFLDSVGKLITQSEILNHLQFSFKGAGINPALVRDFAAVNRTISNDIVNLQKSIMEVRQVEMDNILKKFPRLVRDISHKMGKDVELIVSGQRVPIDKSLLDDVEQAMIHILRNAIDHGLETPAEREAVGKIPRGTIHIDVVQDEASVTVLIQDDGRGLDYEAVRRKALDRGMITQEEYENMDEDASIELVFRSGLTTKEEATDISGRGVGLDVVHSNMRKWGGEVFVDNRPGLGLSFRLLIPITNTLLTKEAILLKLGKDMFCLPLEYVVEIVTVPSDKIHRHKDRVVFQHRDQVISVVDIKGLLGMDDRTATDHTLKTFIIIRGKNNEKKSIGADEIVGQQKIVIKDFEIDAFRRLPYYQGLTLMGDGRVVLILNAEKIAE